MTPMRIQRKRTKNEIVHVHIRGFETVLHDQVREMTREEFDRIAALPERERIAAAYKKLITSDSYGDEFLDEFVFEIEKQ